MSSKCHKSASVSPSKSWLLTTYKYSTPQSVFFQGQKDIELESDIINFVHWEDHFSFWVDERFPRLAGSCDSVFLHTGSWAESISSTRPRIFGFSYHAHHKSHSWSCPPPPLGSLKPNLWSTSNNFCCSFFYALTPTSFYLLILIFLFATILFLNNFFPNFILCILTKDRQ